MVTQRELRNDSAAVLRRVQAGQTLIVTRNGVAVALRFYSKAPGV